MVWLVSGSYVPVTHTAPPPVCQALVLPFQVSLPGSPGAGIVNFRQMSLPVAASRPPIQSRTPWSPFAAPMMILSLMASGAEVNVTSGVSGNAVSHTTLPVSLSVAMIRAGEIPAQGGAAIAELAVLFRIHAPEDAAVLAGSHVDLVEHAPGIGRVEESVLDKRRRHGELAAGAAAERHRIGELQILDVLSVDARQRREALAVVGAVVHQPV